MSEFINAEVVYENCCSCCEKEFDDENRSPIKLDCKHVICGECWRLEQPLFGTGFECGSCGQLTLTATLDRNNFISSRRAIEKLTECIIKSEKAMKVLNERVEEESNEIEEIERYNRKVDCSADLHCSECGNIENERRIQLCETCNFESPENTPAREKEIVSKGFKLNSIAICAVCAIQNHKKKGHTVDHFWLFMNCARNASYCEDLKPKRRNMEEMKSELRINIEKMWETLDESEKELDRMTEFLGCATCTSQQALVHRIEDEIMKHQQFVKKLNSFVNNTSGDMRKVVVNLKMKNDERSVGCNIL